MPNAEAIHEALPCWMQDGVWDLNTLYDLPPDPQE